jgi:hypothetical protein
MLRNFFVIRSGILQVTALVIAFQLAHAVPAHAQAASASIAGTIADAQGRGSSRRHDYGSKR